MGQRKLIALFKAPVTVPVSADTVKTNQDSDITKPDALTDNGILTHTDTVNKVGNDAIESESAKVTDSRKFQTRWEKLWPWVSYDKSTGKMYCEACIKTGKNTTGCTLYKTLLLLLFAMIRSVVKSFKVPDVEVAAARMSNESALTRMTDSTPKKPWSDLTLVLDGYVDSNLPDELSSSGRFHHVQAVVVGT